MMRDPTVRAEGAVHVRIIVQGLPAVAADGRACGIPRSNALVTYNHN